MCRAYIYWRPPQDEADKILGVWRWLRFLRRVAEGSIDVERLGSGRFAAGVERDLLDAGLGLAQQLLAAALEAFATLIDGNRLLKRNLAFLKALHYGFKLLDGAFERQALDVVVVGAVAVAAFSHACFPLSAIRGQHSSQFDARFNLASAR